MPIDALVQSPAGELIHNDVRAKINEVITQVNTNSVQKAFFYSESTASVTINSDSAVPSFLTGLTVTDANGFSLADAATGAIRNDTGRVIQAVTGTINFLPNRGGGGGASAVNLVSERSPDGVSWSGNLTSLRPFEIASTAESFNTKLSFAFDWQPNEWIRFRIYLLSGATLTFEPPTPTVIMGQTFNGSSLIWELKEL